MKKLILFLCLYTPKPIIAKDIYVIHQTSGQRLTVSVNDYFYSGGSNPSVIVTEWKAFDCRPCYNMEVNITSFVKDRFKDDPRVGFASKFSRIGSAGLPGLKKAYCAVVGGADLGIVKRVLFKNPSTSDTDMTSLLGVETSAYQQCMSSSAASTYQTSELNDASRCGVPYYPSVYINGRHTQINSASQLISLIESKL